MTDAGGQQSSTINDSQHANTQSLEAARRLKAERATTPTNRADLQNICKAGESEPKEMRANVTATAEERAKEILSEHVVTDAGGQQASTINDFSLDKVTEAQLQLTHAKTLEAIEQERDCFRGKTESLQRELDDLKLILRQLGMNILKLGEMRNEESCPSGASPQAEAKTDV